jgi:tetratricopeptide (TPR) repeat protein
MTVVIRTILILLLCYVWLPEVSAQQPLLSFDLKGKPKKYEEKKLRSEKTGDKKWTVVRRFTQNGVTKFNWHFNANAKLEEIIARAKYSFKDDFTQLLPFYNFSLQQTSTDRELDSVIYKANAGILLHDLRNTWIDNMYMLMGRAYYYKNILDTAYLTFQYINYIFSPREKDGYDIPIGSNAVEGGNAFSISTKEKTDILHKVWSSPPSRNESFIWQIKTFLAQDEMPEAAGLIETLKHDPNFPDRLETDLKEVQALYFYKQQLYDSAAVYLEQALSNASGGTERARWEYLIAQLWERANNHQQAQEFYDRSIKHTLDPVMEVYARLNSIRQNKGDEKAIQANIDDLVKMARRDKYTNYRDIIYFAAAQMEMERNNVAGAKVLLLKATRYPNPTGDNLNKSRAFLMLGGLSYDEKSYAEAKRYYDSVTVVDSSILSQQVYENRKGALSRIVQQLDIIERQDSLQRIANMPEAAREAFIRKLAKQLRKQQGIKEEEPSGTTDNSSLTQNNNNAPPPDLFGDNAKGEWYFYNSGLKSKGFNEFKNKWGARKNVDNWRRIAAVRQAAAANQTIVSDPNTGNPMTGMVGSDGSANDLSYESLLKNLPLTERQMAVSNDSIENAQVQLGKAYIEGLEEYASAITVLEGFLEKFGYSSLRPEALYLLYYCYNKMGLTASAQRVATELKEKYAGTSFEKTVSNPRGTPEENAAKVAMTKQYEHVYNLFIEGSWQEAQDQKKIADSLYGTNYWTPQLLYIQSVYFIRQRMDDSAKLSLQNIVSMYANTPMAEKAKTLIDVLGRRAQIEEYLTKLQIERPKDDSITTVVDDQPVVVAKPDTGVAAPVVVEEQARIKETITKSSAVKSDSAQKAQRPGINTDKLKRDPLVVNTTPIPQQPVDTVQRQPVAPVKKDSAVVKAREVIVAPGKPAFLYDPNATHMVALVLNKVDPVYITEARNAFNRYNKEKYYNKTFQMGNVAISDTLRIMTISNFENANAAIDYLEKARKAAPGELIPWLPAAKYTFVIVTEANLGILQNTKDVDTYKLFLQQMFPGKF